jgi:hypothetical protein
VGISAVAEEVGEAAQADPGRRDSALGQGFEHQRVEGLSDGAHFLDRAKHERHGIQVGSGRDRGQLAEGEGAAVQLAQPHPPENGVGIPHHAAGVEAEPNGAVCPPLDPVGRGAHVLHPAGAVGSDGRQLDLGGAR